VTNSEQKLNEANYILILNTLKQMMI